MSSLFNVEWTIRCSAPHAILRQCARCATTRSFVSTGRFRLNANGSRLDAWLIYSCGVCGKSWNRAIFERRPVSSMTSWDFRALHSNDPEYAERIARAPFKGGSGRALPDGDFILIRRCVDNSGGENHPVLLVIRNPDLARVRLDKVLVRGLRRNRKEVFDLVESGVFRVRNASPKVLRRPVPAATVIECHAAEGHEVLQLLRRMPE